MSIAVQVDANSHLRYVEYNYINSNAGIFYYGVTEGKVAAAGRTMAAHNGYLIPMNDIADRINGLVSEGLVAVRICI